MLATMDTAERRAWGPLIRAAREAQGLKQEAVAEMANVSRRTLGSIERGDTTAQTDVLRRILVSLNITPTQELDGDVRSFTAMLGPLLQRLGPDERAAVMPVITDLVASALKDSRSGGVIVLDLSKAKLSGRPPMYSFDDEDAAARGEDTEKPTLGNE